MKHPLIGRARVSLALRLAASVLVLAAVAQLVDLDAALARLAGANLRWLLAAGAALTLQTALSAARWRLTAARLGLRIGPLRAISEYYAAQLANQVLPGGVVGDVGRAVRSRHEAGLLRAGQAVVLERLAGQVALVAVGVAAVAVTALTPGGVDWPAGTAAAALALAAGAAVCGLAVRMGARLPGRLAAAGGLAWHALAAREVRLAQAALSLGTVACNIAAFAFCARATGTVLPFGAATALVPVVLLAMLVPLGVAGWGFREGAAAALWPLAGASGAAGAAAGVAFGATLLVASLPGMIPLVTGVAGAHPARKA